MPREPPVSTATLPSAENRSLIADIVAESQEWLGDRQRRDRQRLRAGARAGLRCRRSAATAAAASTGMLRRGRRRRRWGGVDEALGDHDRLGGAGRPVIAGR